MKTLFIWLDYEGIVVTPQYLLQEFFFFFFDGISQLPAVPFEALAQDPPAAGFISRNKPAKNNLVIGEKIDMRFDPFQDLK